LAKVYITHDLPPILPLMKVQQRKKPVFTGFFACRYAPIHTVYPIIALIWASLFWATSFFAFSVTWP
jgi:hypothetical protein